MPYYQVSSEDGQTFKSNEPPHILKEDTLTPSPSWGRVDEDGEPMEVIVRSAKFYLIREGKRIHLGNHWSVESDIPDFPFTTEIIEVTATS